MVQMRRTVDLDVELEMELSDVVSLTKEKPAVVIRQALRAGSPWPIDFSRPGQMAILLTITARTRKGWRWNQPWAR